MKGRAIVIGGTDTAFLVADGEYSVGIGCRKDTPAEEIVTAVRAVLGSSGIRPDQVLVYATTSKKSHESGILDAVRALGRPVLYLDDRTISSCPPHSGSGASRIGLSGVAEPCALAPSKRKELVREKIIIGQYILMTQPGNFTLDGTSKLLADPKLFASPNAFTVTGENAELRSTRLLLGQSGAVGIQYHDAILTWFFLNNYILQTNPGVFVLTGLDAKLLTGFAVSQWGIVTIGDLLRSSAMGGDFSNGRTYDRNSSSADGGDYGE